MMYKIGDGIISPLGSTTLDNYDAVKSGSTGLKSFPAGFRGVPFPYTASLLNPRLLEEYAAPYCGARTHTISRFRQAISAVFESAVTNSLTEFHKTRLFSSKRVAYIFCTTKGNIDSYDNLTSDFSETRLYPWHLAQKMMDELMIQGKPIVLTGSSLGGVQAQLLADRILNASDLYDYAVVIAAELCSLFTLSGMKAVGFLSDDHVRPYDKSRDRGNIGELAACMIFASEKAYKQDKKEVDFPSNIAFRAGSVTCDAYDYMAPSPTGEGLQRAIRKVMKSVSVMDLAFVNSQGLLVPGYDEMNSIAIQKSGLSRVPVNCFEANYGHCFNATGLADTILSCKALEFGEILPTLGFSKPGYTGKMKMATQTGTSKKNSFLKIASGVAGMNGAVVYSRTKN